MHLDNSPLTLLIFLARHGAGRRDLLRLERKYNNCHSFSFCKNDYGFVRRLIVLTKNLKYFNRHSNIIFIHSDPLSLILKILLPKVRTFQIVHNTSGFKSRFGLFGLIDQFILNSDVFFSKNLLFLDQSVMDSYIVKKPKKLISLGVSCGYAVTPNKIENKVLFFGRYLPYKRVEWVVMAAHRIRSVDFYIYSAGFPESIDIPDNCFVNRNHISESKVDDIFSNNQVILLPYSDVTQSGPLYLAREYGLSTVVPNLEFFKRNSCLKNAHFFNVDSFEDFIESINVSMNAPPERCSYCRFD